MGKQINYFINDVDLKELYNYIVSKGDYLVDNTGVSKIARCPDITMFEGYYWIVSSDSRIYYDGKFLDEDKSEIIQFNIGEKLEDNILTPSRIWMASAYVENHEWQDKPDWFHKWFESYRRWLKKYCIKSKECLYYIGKDTYRAYKAGEIIPKNQYSGYEVPFE